MKKIENCYDRAYETQQFLKSTKRVIALIDCKGNGTTLFLRNKLMSKAYIFLTENKNGEIIIANAHNNIEESKNNIDQFVNSCIKEIEQIKVLANFLYLDKVNGTLFRNLTNDSLNIYQKNLQSLHDFSTFFDYYYNYYDFKKYGYIYLIIDKANVVTEQFLRKIKKILDEKTEVKLVFTFITPYVPTEFVNLFNDMEKINFGKPIFENAKIIFKNKNLDESCFDENMYNSCANFEDFQKKYNEIQKLKYEKSPEPIFLFFKMLEYFKCKINKYVLKAFYEYVTNRGCINKQINFENIYSELHKKMIISFSEGEENIKIHLVQNENIKDITIDFNSFIKFLLDKEEYHLLNYETLYFIFKLDGISLSSKFILEIFMRSTNIKHIKEILKLQNYFIKDEKTYLIVYTKLYNMKLFNYIPKIKGLELNQLPYKILYQILDEKKHKKTSDKIYVDCLNKYFSINIDFACLINIMYFDYCINHKRKNLEKFLKKGSIYYYENYSNSKYYYIFQNIVAYYISDFHLALNVFDESINKCLEIPTENNTYFLNNKFVYLLKEYFKNNENIDMKMVGNIYESIAIKQNDEVLSKFINNNIGLYLSCVTQENKFNNNFEYENTWDLFNAINSLVFDFQNNKTFDLIKYLNLEKYVICSNRTPTKILYYYNLYIISKKYKIPLISKIRICFIMLNDINYKDTDIYTKYKVAKKQKKNNNIENLVKYGYISSRVFDINYLIKEIETLNR